MQNSDELVPLSPRMTCQWLDRLIRFVEPDLDGLRVRSSLGVFTQAERQPEETREKFLALYLGDQWGEYCGYAKRDDSIGRALTALRRALPKGAIGKAGSLECLQYVQQCVAEYKEHEVWLISDPEQWFSDTPGEPICIVVGDTGPWKNRIFWGGCTYEGQNFLSTELADAKQKCDPLEEYADWNCDLIQMHRLSPVIIRFLKGWRAWIETKGKHRTPDTLQIAQGEISPQAAPIHNDWRQWIKPDVLKKLLDGAPRARQGGRSDGEKTKAEHLYEKVVRVCQAAEYKGDFPAAKKMYSQAREMVRPPRLNRT